MIPKNLDEWNSDVIKKLIGLEYEEDQNLEYKEAFDIRGEDKKANRVKIEELLSSFANSYGGFAIFGITDDWNIKGIGIKENEEINLLLGQITNVKPPINFKAKIINIDSKNNILIVQVEESLDKPIQCSNGSFHMRIGSQTVPISRDILQDWFISKELKKQRYEKLMFEINWIKKVIEKEKSISSSRAMPPFHKLRIKELQDSVSDYYGYFKEGADIHINYLNHTFSDIEEAKIFFDIESNIALRKRWGMDWADLSGYLNYMSVSFLRTNQRLYGLFRDLKSQLDKLKEFI